MIGFDCAVVIGFAPRRIIPVLVLLAALVWWVLDLNTAVAVGV